LRTAGTAFATTSFYRISGITLAVPSLRERPNDLPTLLANEIERASRRQGTSIVGLDRDAVDRLLAYRWPGNLARALQDRAGRRGADDRRP
jgi:two-component system nitrogen regulation response regulator GlnG